MHGKFPERDNESGTHHVISAKQFDPNNVFKIKYVTKTYISYNYTTISPLTYTRPVAVAIPNLLFHFVISTFITKVSPGTTGYFRLTPSISAKKKTAPGSTPSNCKQTTIPASCASFDRRIVQRFPRHFVILFSRRQVACQQACMMEVGAQPHWYF